jgi:hypothetical protein
MNKKEILFDRKYDTLKIFKIIIIVGILVELARHYKIIQVTDHIKSMGLHDAKENPGSRFTCILLPFSIFVIFSGTIT